MSFAMRPMEKPEAKVSEMTNCLSFTSVELLRPVEALSTSVMTFGSRPKAWPTRRASTAATRPAPET